MSLAKRLLIAYLIGLGPFTLAAIYVLFGATRGGAHLGAVFWLVIVLVTTPVFLFGAGAYLYVSGKR